MISLSISFALCLGSHLIGTCLFLRDQLFQLHLASVLSHNSDHFPYNCDAEVYKVPHILISNSLCLHWVSKVFCCHLFPLQCLKLMPSRLLHPHQHHYQQLYLYVRVHNPHLLLPICHCHPRHASVAADYLNAFFHPGYTFCSHVFQWYVHLRPFHWFLLICLFAYL
jgi:hypothetical protein